MPYLPGNDLADASGVGLLDGAAAALGEAGLDFGAILLALNNIRASVVALPSTLSYEWLADRLAEWLGTDRVTLGQAVLALLSVVPGLGNVINTVISEGILNVVAGLDPKVDAIKGDTETIIAGMGGDPQEILDAIAAVRGSGNPDIAAVLTALGALPAAPTTGEIADAVWWWYHLSGENVMYEYLQAAGNLSFNQSNQIALPIRGAPMFAVTTNWPYLYSQVPSYPPPTPDWSDIQVGDTRLSWLQRTDVSLTWTADEYTGEPVAIVAQSGEHGPLKIWPAFSEPQFQGWGASGVVSGAGPPLWPGLAGVTLGTPQVLTDSAIIDGPMDGILLTDMTVGNQRNTWAVDTFVGVYRGGYIVFLSDEGHAEPTQYIGPTQAVYSRQGMTSAAQCVVKLNNVAEVTVTPWTLA